MVGWIIKVYMRWGPGTLGQQSLILGRGSLRTECKSGRDLVVSSFLKQIGRAHV